MSEAAERLGINLNVAKLVARQYEDVGVTYDPQFAAQLAYRLPNFGQM